MHYFDAIRLLTAVRAGVVAFVFSAARVNNFETVGKRV